MRFWQTDQHLFGLKKRFNEFWIWLSIKQLISSIVTLRNSTVSIHILSNINRRWNVNKLFFLQKSRYYKVKYKQDFSPGNHPNSSGSLCVVSEAFTDKVHPYFGPFQSGFKLLEHQTYSLGLTLMFNKSQYRYSQTKGQAKARTGSLYIHTI